MRKAIITLTAGAAALAMGAAFAGHHEGKKEMSWEEKEAKAMAELEEMHAKVDANGDGSVTEDEYMAHKAAEAAKKWAKWTEGDADGAITLEEAKAIQAARMAEKRAKYEEKKDM
ncbi:MAG: hypothetical protein AAFW81_07085 [Pseudomonadota bacterium]